jgi:hypothetical protein
MTRFPRITTENVAELREAIFLLQDRLADLDPQAPRTCPAYGCCGCGAAMADVNTPPAELYPLGEAYCWRCVKRKDITKYTALPGR